MRKREKEEEGLKLKERDGGMEISRERVERQHKSFHLKIWYYRISDQG